MNLLDGFSRWGKPQRLKADHYEGLYGRPEGTALIRSVTSGSGVNRTALQFRL